MEIMQIATANVTALVVSAIIGFIFLLFLIIKVKLQPIVAILIAAILIGLGAGMTPTMIIDSINKGVSSTLQGIALLVGLGSMFGAILEVSGGAEKIAVTLIDKFGEKKAPLALAITGLIVGMPIFFDAGLIILIPLAFSLGARTKKSLLNYAIPLLAGLAVGHTFIPPTPGPVLVATMLGVDLGYIIGFGIIIGSVVMVVAGLVFGKFIGARINVPLPKSYSEMSKKATEKKAKQPSFLSVVLIILIPLFLILLSTVSKVVPSMASLVPILNFLGTPFIALIIAILIAIVVLGKGCGYSMVELEKIMTKALEPTGLILLVTAGGGVLRWILQDSGLGEVIGNSLASSSLPIVVAAFLIALLVRISVGSATVAMTLAAGIVAAMPETAGLSPIYLTATTIAIASGATACSHVNDSGFWLVKSLFELDEKTTLKTWTAMESIIGLVGFVGAIILAQFG